MKTFSSGHIYEAHSKNSTETEFPFGQLCEIHSVAFGNCLNPFLVGTICFIKNIFAFQFFLIPMDVIVETLLSFLKRVPLPLLFLLLDCVCASNMRRPFSLEAINYFWDKQSLLVWSKTDRGWMLIQARSIYNKSL